MQLEPVTMTEIENENIDITNPIIIKNGKDGILFVHSSMIDEINTLDTLLQEKNINLSFATVPMITTKYKFEEMLKNYDYIFTLEEHYLNGGFGSILTDYVNENDICKKVNKFGIKNEYIHKIGNRDFLREYYEINASHLAIKIQKVIQNG